MGTGGSGDLAYIANKVAQGLALSPQEQAQWNAHVKEGNARAAGAGGAANGTVSGSSQVLPALAAGAQFAFDPGGHLPVASRINQIGGAIGAGPAAAPGATAAPFVQAPNGQWVPSGAGGAAGGSVNPSDPIAALVAEAKRQQQATQDYLNGTVSPQLGAIRGAQAGVLGGQTAQDQQYADALNGYVGKAQNDAGAANSLSGQGLAAYGSALGAVNQQNTGYVDQLAALYAGMPQLQATHQVANQQAVQSALALSDYHTAQLYQAALERAQANPNDVQAQKDVLALSQKISQGGNDVQNGGLTPEAKAAQLSALSQYGALTSPEVTAKERFLYEQQRMQQEQEEKASRDALMQDYRLRGMGGSGAELANVLQSGQQNSQQRLLGDLGTQAGAVDRSMQALAGYGGLSTQMMAQGNQVDQFNQSQRLQGLGLSADMANQIAANSQQLSEYNAGQANQVNVANAGFANQNAQFNANAYNQNAMSNSQQTNAVNMYNTGQTNMVNMNNLNQNMAQGQFEDNYRATQQQNAAIRGQNLATTGLTAGANNATNLTNFSTQFQQGVNDTASRNNTATGVGIGAAGTIHGAQTNTNNQALGLGTTWGNQTLGLGGLYTGANQNTSTGVQDALTKAGGQQAANAAINSVGGGDPSDPLNALLGLFKKA
jgi:hypothetical protein